MGYDDDRALMHGYFLWSVKMKRLLALAIGISMLTTTTHATETSAKQVDGNRIVAACESAKDAARIVMVMRQMDADKSKVLEVSDSDIYRAYVTAAYNLPKYETTERRSKAIDEFADAAFLQCYKMLTKDK